MKPNSEPSLPKQIEVPYYPQQEHPLLAAPGYTNVTISNHVGEVDPTNPPVGEPGEYEVIFTLRPPGQAAEKLSSEDGRQIVDIATDKLSGDSHLVLCSPEGARPSSGDAIELVTNVSVNKPDSRTVTKDFTFKSNASGRVSQIFISLTAENFNDAEQRAYFEASQLLSDYALKLDIPLRIAHTHIKEVATKNTMTGYVRQFDYRSLANLPESGVGGSGFNMIVHGSAYKKGSAYPGLASIYREGLNSDSPFYQILCFCRIIQRLNKLRPRWKAIFREHGVELPLYLKDEKMPSNEGLAARMPEEFRGKKFTTVYKDYLRPFRNGIGHVFLEDERDEESEQHSADEFAFVSKAYNYLPAAHHIARRMLENDYGSSGLSRYSLELQARSAD